MTMQGSPEEEVVNVYTTYCFIKSCYWLMTYTSIRYFGYEVTGLDIRPILQPHLELSFQDYQRSVLDMRRYWTSMHHPDPQLEFDSIPFH